MAREPVWKDLGYTEMEWRALPPKQRRKEETKLTLRYAAFIAVPVIGAFLIIGFFALLQYLQYLTMGG